MKDNSSGSFIFMVDGEFDQELLKIHPKAFQEGEIIIIRGSRLRVEKINRNKITFKLLHSTEQPDAQSHAQEKYFNSLIGLAKKYHGKAQESIKRNGHMHDMADGEKVLQRHIDAVLADFVNYIGSVNGIDVGLYTKDLKAEPGIYAEELKEPGVKIKEVKSETKPKEDKP